MDAAELYLLSSLFLTYPNPLRTTYTGRDFSIAHLTDKGLVGRFNGRLLLTVEGAEMCERLLRTLNERPIDALHQAIRGILRGGGSWESKHDRAFAAYSASGLRLDYYNPDTTYEEDVRALANAVREAAGL